MHYLTPEYSFPYALIKPKSKIRNNAALVPSLDYIHNLKLVYCCLYTYTKKDYRFYVYLIKITRMHKCSL